MEGRDVCLNDTGLWLLYRAMVCEVIELSNAQDKIDCDPWKFSGALDMSFEETKLYPLAAWHEKIGDDFREYLAMKK